LRRIDHWLVLCTILPLVDFHFLSSHLVGKRPHIVWHMATKIVLRVSCREEKKPPQLFME
jgi:hypothetical protein